MYHIVFNSNNAYIKYAAVLMTNIIKTTKIESNFKKERYHFHILIDFISEESKSRLFSLEKELNYIYPCKIDYYITNNSLFETFNLAKIRGGFAAYYRVFLASSLPYFIKKCIYLDIDTLILKDIRELFHINLNNKILGVVGSLRWYPNLKARSNSDLDYKPSHFHFNSGVMLINLEKWKKYNIEDQCIQFIKKYHIHYLGDESILNGVLKNDYLELTTDWNMTFGFMNMKNSSFDNEEIDIKKNNHINFTREMMEGFIKNPKIIHFTGGGDFPKAWQNLGKTLNPSHYSFQNYIYRKLWWDIALETPIYNKDLMELKNNLKMEFIDYFKINILPKLKQYDIFITQIQTLTNEKDLLQNEKIRLQNSLNSIPTKKANLEIQNLEQDINLKKFKIYQIQKDLGEKFVQNISVNFINTNCAKARIHSHLSYKLGQAMIVNSKSLLGYIRMPFVLSYIRDKHKQEQKIYQEKIKKDPSLKLPPLESYPDYKEALKEKECFTYKLGEALIRANNNWYGGGYIKLWFEIRKLKKEFKKDKKYHETN
ncbi:glycosyltransferase family 8 protein [Campylobacter coli]|uniref:glycosyltransferase family 8 protein n=1 Tax=Campylobacter coli TaxID=195 RepID=UPI0009A8E07A|nr:glycosyltransferase family 8 protein [Campylobacter coli]